MITVSWTASALGADFARYIVSRGGEPIAHINTEATTSFADHEHRIGVQESYTVQVEHVNGTTSLPSAAATVTVTQAVRAWRLTSNADPSINLDVAARPGLGYTFHEDRAETRLYGRDMVRVDRGLEQRGDEFTFEVSLFGDLDGAADRVLFDDLLAVRDAAVPYVCVTNPWGRRWFAALTVAGGSEPILASHALADLRVREVAAVPAVVEVA